MFYEHTAYQDSQFYLYRQIQRANFPLLQREYNVVKRTIPYIQIIIPFHLVLILPVNPFTLLWYLPMLRTVFQRSMPHLQGLWTAAWLPPCLSAEADISYKVPLLYFRLQWPALYRLWQEFSLYLSVRRFWCCCRSNPWYHSFVSHPIWLCGFKQHIFLLIYRLRHRFIQQIRKQLPKTVLLVSVIEIVFPWCNGRQSAEDQYAAVFIIDRLEGVGYVFVFHIVTSYICSSSSGLSIHFNYTTMPLFFTTIRIVPRKITYDYYTLSILISQSFVHDKK